MLFVVAQLAAQAGIAVIAPSAPSQPSLPTWLPLRLLVMASDMARNTANISVNVNLNSETPEITINGEKNKSKFKNTTESATESKQQPEVATEDNDHIIVALRQEVEQKTKKLDEQEGELAALRHRTADLEQKLRNQQHHSEQLLHNLSALLPWSDFTQLHVYRSKGQCGAKFHLHAGCRTLQHDAKPLDLCLVCKAHYAL